jgi:hypothetical protein
MRLVGNGEYNDFKTAKQMFQLVNDARLPKDERGTTKILKNSR